MLRIILITTLFVIFGVNIFAQSTEDEAAIKECIMNYVEGYYEADADRMDKAIHPELAKRAVFEDKEGNQFVQGMSKSLLVHAARHNTNKRGINPDAEFEANIQIFDITGIDATAKCTTNKFTFFDYIHLTKWNGEWKIINVLWNMLPPPEEN
jgi:Putative lumazine-binding